MTTLPYAEDDDNAFMLTQRPARRGTEVWHVEIGEEALNSAVWKLPVVIQLDLSRPGVDGRTMPCCQRPNLLTRALLVIVVSASVQQHGRVSALDAGATASVTQPIDFAKLIAVLSSWLPVRTREEEHR